MCFQHWGFSSIRSRSTFWDSDELHIGSSSQDIDIHFLFSTLWFWLLFIPTVLSSCGPTAKLAHWPDSPLLLGWVATKPPKLAQLQHQQTWATLFVSSRHFIDSFGRSVWTRTFKGNNTPSDFLIAVPCHKYLKSFICTSWFPLFTWFDIICMIWLHFRKSVG